MAMSFTMGLNFILLVAMVATNILSLYHLSTTTSFFRRPSPPPQPAVPGELLRQLHTIRSTINHLSKTPQKDSNKQLHKKPFSSDLIAYSHTSPIASSCHDYPELLHRYMNYTPFGPCPTKGDTQLAEALVLRGCHPLPRRRCFFNQNHIFDNNDVVKVMRKFMSYKSELDLTIPQLLDVAKRTGSVIRVGVDIGGGSGDFAAMMRERNVTVVTTTMNLGKPYSEGNVARGVVPIHMPLQQRLPVFDGVVDLVRCGHGVNRWVPVHVMEFLLYDVDRVLRGGGFLWIDHFFSKGVDLDKVYKPLISRLGYRIFKWATGNKTDSSGVKNGEVYLTALLQKPKSR